MPTLGQNVNIIAELTPCRRPSWTRIVTPDYVGAPDTADDGAALSGAPAARILVKLRESVWRRTARVTVSVFDGTADYTVSVDGTAIATTTGVFATVDAILVELKAKITADATVGQAAAIPIVDSYLIDIANAVTVGTAGGGTAAVALIVIGEAQEDFYIDISATSTGELACKADPITATAYVYLVPTGVGETSSADEPATTDFALADDGTYSVTRRGLAVNVPGAGGWSRCYVELASIAKHASDGADVTVTDANSPVVLIGRATRETS